MKNIGGKRPKRDRTGHYSHNVQLAKETPEARKKPPVKPKRRARNDLEDDKYLDEDEIHAFFDVIKSKRDAAIFRLVYHRGLRAHEVGLLNYSDFRDKNGTGTLYVRRGKGSRSSDYCLVAAELHAMRLWIRERGRHRGPLFPSRNGGPIRRSRLDQLMKGYCAEAGIRAEKAHMHALKHSCGTHLADRGNDAAAIKDWLGHRDSKSTDIYMHFSSKRRAETFERNRDWK